MSSSTPTASAASTTLCVANRDSRAGHARVVGEQVCVVCQLNSDRHERGTDLIEVACDQYARVRVDGQPPVLVSLGVLTDVLAAADNIVEGDMDQPLVQMNVTDLEAAQLAAAHGTQLCNRRQLITRDQVAGPHGIGQRVAHLTPRRAAIVAVDSQGRNGTVLREGTACAGQVATTPQPRVQLVEDGSAYLARPRAGLIARRMKPSLVCRVETSQSAIGAYSSSSFAIVAPVSGVRALGRFLQSCHKPCHGLERYCSIKTL